MVELALWICCIPRKFSLDFSDILFLRSLVVLFTELYFFLLCLQVVSVAWVLYFLPWCDLFVSVPIPWALYLPTNTSRFLLFRSLWTVFHFLPNIEEGKWSLLWRAVWVEALCFEPDLLSSCVIHCSLHKPEWPHLLWNCA